VWYSYAIVLLVPRVERGEFLHDVVVLISREQEVCRASVELDTPRLLSLAPNIDLDAVQRHLGTLLAICEGRPAGGPIAALNAPERFYWLVAPRSTMIQTSPVHVGRSDDEPDAALENLLAEFVRLPTAVPAAASGRAGDHSST
jgi:hypothetical protein